MRLADTLHKKTGRNAQCCKVIVVNVIIVKVITKQQMPGNASQANVGGYHPRGATLGIIVKVIINKQMPGTWSLIPDPGRFGLRGVIHTHTHIPGPPPHRPPAPPPREVNELVCGVKPTA